MFWRVAVILSSISVAIFVLTVSVLKAASVNYSFSSSMNSPQQVLGETAEEIDYELPYPGRILPDHPLWPLKVLRDKIWLVLTTDHSRKAEISLLFADKRLVSSRILFEKGKSELAFSTFTKAEKYLEQASLLKDKTWEEGMNSEQLTLKITLAALKHQEVTRDLLILAPEDVKPEIIRTEGLSKEIYKKGREQLMTKGLESPKNPFNGD
jgi:hypothetical protein